jgi:peroxiredoxin
LTQICRSRHCKNVVRNTAPEARGFFKYPFQGVARHAVILAAAFALPGAGIIPAAAAPGELPGPAATLQTWSGPPQPAFELKDIKGKTLALPDYRGQPVLVHFFATWCEPCRPEMQALERLARRPEAQALRIVSISVNEPGSRVRRFFESMPVSFPVLLDDDRATAKAWGVDTLPTTYLLDADLVARLHVARDVAWDRLDIAAILDALTARRGGQGAGDQRPPANVQAQ